LSELNHDQQWAIVEVMGHSVYAGRVQPDTSMGVPMVRVDVPEVDGAPGFTKLLAPGSLFGITPCSQELATETARRYRTRPVSILDLPARPALGRSADHDEDDEECLDDDDWNG